MVSDIYKIEAWYFYQLHGTCGGLGEFYGFMTIYLAQWIAYWMMQLWNTSFCSCNLRTSESSNKSHGVLPPAAPPYHLFQFQPSHLPTVRKYVRIHGTWTHCSLQVSVCTSCTPRLTWTRLRSPSCTCLSLCPSLFSWWVSSDHCQSEQNKQKLPSSSKETSIIFTNMMGAKPTVNGSSTTKIGPTRKEQCAVLKRINKIIKHFLWWHQMSNSQKNHGTAASRAHKERRRPKNPCSFFFINFIFILRVPLFSSFRQLFLFPTAGRRGQVSPGSQFII